MPAVGLPAIYFLFLLHKTQTIVRARSCLLLRREPEPTKAGEQDKAILAFIFFFLHKISRSILSQMHHAMRHRATSSRSRPMSVREAVSPFASSTRYDAPPDEAIAAVSGFDGPILVDLDETLYLRNSTEDFIDSAWPQLPALVLMYALDALRPWRWMGGAATRDAWRVLAIKIFFPWTAQRWKRRVRALADRFTNRRLVAAIRGRAASGSHFVIVTIGFQSIVGPLVAAMGLSAARIVAARGVGFADRRRGKLDLTIAALGEDAVRRALAITDSIQDVPLLDVCCRSLRTVWPDARFRQAFAGVYLPGRYTSSVKRPGSRYIINCVLQEDYVYWVLASISLAGHPAFHVLGLWFLLFSFWSIYERGYVDNDRVAARYEKDPVLSSAFENAPAPMLAPWVWAAVSGVVAILLLRYPAHPDPGDFGKWLAVLVATQSWFHIYNRFDKQTRIWLYLGLQFARAAALAALVPISLIGAAALTVLITSRWMHYYIYRMVRGSWPAFKNGMNRILLFMLLMLLLCFAQGRAAVWSWTAIVLLGWMAFKARGEILAVIKSAYRLGAVSEAEYSEAKIAAPRQ